MQAARLAAADRRLAEARRLLANDPALQAAVDAYRDAYRAEAEADADAREAAWAPARRAAALREWEQAQEKVNEDIKATQQILGKKRKIDVYSIDFNVLAADVAMPSDAVPEAELAQMFLSLDALGMDNKEAEEAAKAVVEAEEAARKEAAAGAHGYQVILADVG